jgi:hypothetical protein
MRREIWSAYICSVQPRSVTNEACKRRDAVNNKEASIPNSRSRSGGYSFLVSCFSLLLTPPNSSLAR